MWQMDRVGISSLLAKQNAGATFAIYPKGDMKAMNKLNKCVEGRINMYAEADYTENTTAYMDTYAKIITAREKYEEEKHDCKYAAEDPNILFSNYLCLWEDGDILWI